MYNYNIYTMAFESEIKIPFLTEVKNSDSSKITLNVKYTNNLSYSINKKINETLYVNSQGNLILDIPNICIYAITDNQILINPYNETDSQTITNFLVSSAIPYYLAKQGKIILRGCSFTRSEKSANLLLGHSGVGKSTFVAALTKKDYKILSDQFCVLSMQNNKIYVEPAFSHIKLWYQATRRLKIDSEKLLKVRPNLKRFYWEAPFCNKKLEIKNIFKIREQNLESDKLSEKVKGINKINFLQNSIFGDDLLALDKKNNLPSAKTKMLLASQANCFRVLNIRGKTTIDDFTKLITELCNEE